VAALQWAGVSAADVEAALEEERQGYFQERYAPPTT
jgi:hypothetical protein